MQEINVKNMRLLWNPQSHSVKLGSLNRHFHMLRLFFFCFAGKSVMDIPRPEEGSIGLLPTKNPAASPNTPTPGSRERRLIPPRPQQYMYIAGVAEV